MKRLTLIIVVLFMAWAVPAQTVKRDPAGNFVQVKDTSGRRGGSQAKATGKTFTDGKGNVYPVFVSVNGKYFVRKTSKRTGNEYNCYLKLQ